MEKDIIKDYLDGKGLDYLCKTYKIGKLKAKKILTENGIEIRPKSSFSKKRAFLISDWRIEKYPINNDIVYKAISKDGVFETYDYMNAAGVLTTYIKNLGIEIPSLYDRRIYYQETGNYWWEQWFDIVSENKKPTKKCPYCEWETEDVVNKSGAFKQHLLKIHNITLEKYIEEYPDDISYFPSLTKKVNKEEKLTNTDNFIVCPICGNKYEKMTLSHLRTHGLCLNEFKSLYPNFDMLSINMRNQTNEANKLGNLTIGKHRFVSKYEREIQEYLNKHNVTYVPNRQILIGREVDILIPDKKIGIEFNGLKWHTEWFGHKSHSYHLDKTLQCNEKGYGLIHIFEDEYVNNKEIVYSKLSHIIGLDVDLPRVMGRKCIVKEIYMNEAKEFLTKYHIQGFVSSSVYIGAFYNEQLVAVMTFKNGSLKNPCWELTRFASDYHYRFQGVGGKLFSYFIKKYSPNKIISFADRRWTINAKKNLYTNLGFTIEKYGKPDYKYYKDNSKDGYKYQRIHKMTFNKKTLSKKYGFPLTMTETEMAKELGYDRIWDCGLIKYVWKKKEI